MNIYARPDMTSIQTSFRVIAQARGRPLAQVMRASGRRIAIRLTKYTQPFGFGDTDKTKGEAAVSGDIAKIFDTPKKIADKIAEKEKAAARGFRKLMAQGMFREAEALLARLGIKRTITEAVPVAAHKGARNARGRVTTREPQFVIANPRTLSTYVREVAKRVGFTAAGWAACARDLGGYRGLSAGDNVPPWKKPGARGRKSNASGATVTGEANDPIVTMNNEAPWLSKACPRDIQARAIREEIKTTERELDRALKHQMKKAGFL